ncbi:MAG: hypothetical protein U0K56_09645, partial [Bacteroidaceae bacterium]|nr:hypothetical protein [Bacteroidaceae bacterium]
RLGHHTWEENKCFFLKKLHKNLWGRIYCLMFVVDKPYLCYTKILYYGNEKQEQSCIYLLRLALRAGLSPW